MTITALELESYKPKNKPYIIREKQHNKKDGTLGFKILPSGDRDAYFIYYIDGKEKLKKIGRYGKTKGLLTLKNIRDKYLDLSKEYQGGVDIKIQALEQASALKKKQLELADIELKKQRQGSFQQLTDLYLEHVKINLSSKHYGAMKKAFSLNLENFDGNLKASDITKQDITTIINKISARGSLVAANRMRSYLSAMFTWGIQFDDGIGAVSTDVKFYIDSNPVTQVQKPLKNEPASDRYLTKSEVAIFWKALNQSGMTIHRANILKLMIATGCRVEAASGLKWSDIDWEERLITIPPERSKKGNYWIIPIGEIAYEILSKTPKISDEFLFPADNGVGTVSSDSLGKAVSRTCEQFKIKHFSPKDLRTTFKTLAGMAGISKENRDRIQNHATNDVSAKHYDRYDYLKEKREAIFQWNDYLKNIIEDTDNPDDMKK